ncbi:hypothetical protein HF925_01640 [Acidithiobacillus ferriphilus]|uniref:hypothetical protein n=1 Tax=Acidithiobacillus ferriphilus TaxID=1689834 RepID=UPI001C075FA9|nr:hypothetical protein [Acidithiobacillus ferriphilus]MBU2847301.1 hypothetical protein [Acidithiobacillus ferriphilus]
MEKLLLYTEKYGPIASSILAVVVWILLCAPFPSKPSDILISSISFGAIVTGFLSTTEGILLTINPRSTLVTKLYNSKQFIAIISYLAHAVRVGILFSVLSMVMLIDKHLSSIKGMQILWIFLAALLVFSFFRITEIIIKILKLPPNLR